MDIHGQTTLDASPERGGGQLLASVSDLGVAAGYLTMVLVTHCYDAALVWHASFVILTFRSRVSLVVMLALAYGGAGAVVGATGAAGAPRVASAGYWTRFRMEHAVPMGSPVAAGRAPGRATGAAVAEDAAHGQRVAARGVRGQDGARGQDAARGQGGVVGGVVARDTGKVFFVLDGTDFVCSGATVGGPRVSVIVTAAHCVTDGYGGWATHWVFVPGYDNGAEPYGSYSSSRFFVSRQWNAGMNETYDVAFVAVKGLSGGLPVRFDTTPRSAYVFGYPADAPFTGGELRYCDGPVSQDPQDPGADRGIRCDMTAGDSGGPWLTGFRTASGTGTVVAISAFKYSDNDSTLYGAVLGHVARELYKEALKAS
jgi:hypothetical protein